MKRLLLILLSLASFLSALGQEAGSQDYLIQLQLNISEAKIPNYLIGVIYDRPTAKEITTPSVTHLYQANGITLATARNILDLLEIPQAQVFSINGLHYNLRKFNLTFTNFYNDIITRLDLTGLPLINALTKLGIDAPQFSQGIAYGVPDPWEEFIKGNFAQANVEAACAEVEITLETLWSEVRDLFLVEVEKYEIEDFISLLLEHNINKAQALTIWNAVPVTVQHVYSIDLYNSIINNFRTIVNSQTAFGVVTGFEEVVVHRLNYDVFKADQDLLDIRALTLVTRTSLVVDSINDTAYANLVVLRHGGSADVDLTTIPIEFVNSDVTDCTYVTFQNNNLLNVNVPSATFHDQTYELPRSLVQNVISGSPLVCDSGVRGLTRGVVEGVIIVDSFSDFEAPQPDNNSSLRVNCGFGLLLMVLMKVFLL